MTDKERIAQLERENLELKVTLLQRELADCRKQLNQLKIPLEAISSLVILTQHQRDDERVVVRVLYSSTYTETELLVSDLRAVAKFAEGTND